MLQKRGIPYRRAQTKRIIQRKRNVLRKKYQMEPEDWFSGKHGANHHLDKAKVHCSCKLCSAKTKKKMDGSTATYKKCKQRIMRM